jgi:hypothetical protein
MRIMLRAAIAALSIGTSRRRLPTKVALIPTMRFPARSLVGAERAIDRHNAARASSAGRHRPWPMAIPAHREVSR